jgi:flavin reductase (DIM6/NTAB) family NADH-FMN oxidoreductase RutF
MTLGWHTVMEFSPSLVGCVIANSDFSFELIRKSRECVINAPSVELVDGVVVSAIALATRSTSLSGFT